MSWLKSQQSKIWHCESKTWFQDLFLNISSNDSHILCWVSYEKGTPKNLIRSLKSLPPIFISTSWYTVLIVKSDKVTKWKLWVHLLTYNQNTQCITYQEHGFTFTFKKINLKYRQKKIKKYKTLLVLSLWYVRTIFNLILIYYIRDISIL